MSTLNFIWRFIQSFEEDGPRVRDTPSGVISQLIMFLGLLPLAHMDFRSCVSGLATASDASWLGGGVSSSDQVTTLGMQVALSPLEANPVRPLKRGLFVLGFSMASEP